MDEFLKWLQSPTGQTLSLVFGISGWLIAIISGWLQWKSYREQKQNEKGYREILERAKQDWDGRYTEEQVQQLTKQFTQLQEQIRQDVPLQARRVFLEDRLNTLSENIALLYSQYNDLTKEYSEMPMTILPQPMRDAIEKEIKPIHLIKQRHQRITLILLSLILVFLVIPIAPFFYSLIPARIPVLGWKLPFNYPIIFIFIVSLITYIFKITINKRISVWVTRHPIISVFPIIVGWLISFMFTVLLIGVASDLSYSHLIEERVMLIPYSLITSIPISLSLLLTIDVLLTWIENERRNTQKQRELKN
jgi:hypothetical protein